MLLSCGVGEDSWESLGLQDQSVNPKGNQSWIFIGRTDAENETPILWPPDAKTWLIGNNPIHHCNEKNKILRNQFSSVQLLSSVRLFVTPWTAAHQPSLSIANSQSLLKLMSIELVIPSNHLILCHPLLLPPSIFPSIRVFSNESALRIRWPQYWSFSFNIRPTVNFSLNL